MKKNCSLSCPAATSLQCIVSSRHHRNSSKSLQISKTEREKKGGREGAVTHPIQLHTRARVPYSSEPKTERNEATDTEREKGAARDETLGEEAADRLVEVHVTLPQRRVDLRVGAVHDLIQPLHQLPRGRRHRARRPPRAPSAAHPRRNPEPGVSARLRRQTGSQDAAIRGPSEWYGRTGAGSGVASPLRLLPPSERNTQRRPMPKFQNPPCLPLAYLYIPRFAAVGKKQIKINSDCLVRACSPLSTP
jgi:hypothetical protein